MAGRIARGIYFGDEGSFGKDLREVRQAMTCMATNLENRSFLEFMIQKPEDITILLVRLAQKVFDEPDGRGPRMKQLGAMAIGWAFQASLEEGLLDDM